jgi:hypothetical protein
MKREMENKPSKKFYLPFQTLESEFRQKLPYVFAAAYRQIEFRQIKPLGDGLGLGLLKNYSSLKGSY